jgi:micrococcal nuclease
MASSRTTAIATALLLLVCWNLVAQEKKVDPPKEGESKQTIEGTVIKVVDGNTVTVQPEGQRKIVTIRLIGMDAPKKATRDMEGQEPWGVRAQQYLSLQITRKKVKIEFDVVVPTPDGKATWGYVWLGDKLMNEDMLAAGHAVLATQPPNVKYVERLQEAQRTAREGKKNIWNPDEPLPEEPAKFVATKQKIEDERKEIETDLRLPAFVEGCVVANKATKKYHLPGGRYYESSKESKNAIFFKNAEDARKAGYEPSSR